jgi:hypothetical protein
MADFSLWAAACETAVWPAGTLARVYGSQPHSCHREHYRSRSASRCVRTII